MEFLRSFLRRHLAGKPVVASPNVGCFLRLQFKLFLSRFLSSNFVKIIKDFVVCVIPRNFTTTNVNKFEYNLVRNCKENKTASPNPRKATWKRLNLTWFVKCYLHCIKEFDFWQTILRLKIPRGDSLMKETRMLVELILLRGTNWSGHGSGHPARRAFVSCSILAYFRKTAWIK